MWRLIIFVVGLAIFSGAALAEDFEITGADVATRTEGIPWDAAPDPDGNIFYFTTSSGVFSVPAAGGEIATLAQGMVAPFGIGVSTDGQTIYVADPWSAGPAGNGIFAIPAAGGDPAIVEGTFGTSPRALDVANENGADFLYFSGVNPADGAPAVFKILASGGFNSIAIFSGAPLVDPSGIAVTQTSEIFVIDRLAAGNGLGSVFHINGPDIETVATDIRTGAQLAGVALTQDESTLLVSQLDPDAGTAQVLLVNLESMTTNIVDAVINVNTSAGGLHRAHNVDTFAWIDSGGGSEGGQVYRVRGQPTGF
jgi:DNA-binding beta-propeller fold protein YncE